MIDGIGLDLIETARFARGDNPHFMKRCFTAYEMAYLQGRGRQTMAGLFAAKEAVVKALGTGFRGFWPCEVEIRHDAQGRPYASLFLTAARLAAERGITGFLVSITHHQTAAAAVAVALAGRPAATERNECDACCNKRANARRRICRRAYMGDSVAAADGKRRRAYGSAYSAIAGRGRVQPGCRCMRPR